MFSSDTKRYLTKIILFGIGLSFVGGWGLNAKNQLYLYFGFEDLDSIWSTIVAFLILGIAFLIGSVLLYILFYLVCALFGIEPVKDRDDELLNFSKSYLFLYTLGENLIGSSLPKGADEWFSPIIILLFIHLFIPGNILINNYKGVGVIHDTMRLQYSNRYLIPSNDETSYSYGEDVVSTVRFVFKSAGHFEGYRSRNNEQLGLVRYVFSIPVYFLESIIKVLTLWGIPYIIITRLFAFRNRNKDLK